MMNLEQYTKSDQHNKHGNNFLFFFGERHS